MKKPLAAATAVTVAALAFMSFGPTAMAQEATFRTPGFVSGEPGSTVFLNEVPVPAELVGRSCELSDIIQNNESVHLGNDLIVTTGSTVVVFENYEDAPFKITEASGTVELGTTIKFELRFGPDGITSRGNTVSVDCSPAPEPTTPEPTTPTTEPPAPEPTTPEPTTPETTDPAGPTVDPTTPTTDGSTTTTTAPPPLQPAPVPSPVDAQPPLAG